MSRLPGFEEIHWFGKALWLFNQIDREAVDLAHHQAIFQQLYPLRHHQHRHVERSAAVMGSLQVITNTFVVTAHTADWRCCCTCSLGPS